MNQSRVLIYFCRSVCGFILQLIYSELRSPTKATLLWLMQRDQQQMSRWKYPSCLPNKRDHINPTHQWLIVSCSVKVSLVLVCMSANVTITLITAGVTCEYSWYYSSLLKDMNIFRCYSRCSHTHTLSTKVQLKFSGLINSSLLCNCHLI